MLHPEIVAAWKKAPFARLLIPFIAGILIQWYYQLTATTAWLLLIISLLLIITISLAVLPKQFRLRWLKGLSLHLLLFSAACLLVFYKSIRHNPAWINNHYSEGNTVLVTLEEPLSEKTRSFKVITSARAVIRNNGESTIVKGNILLYFQKDSSLSHLQYGNQLVFKKTLQLIKNAGNPGSFKYQRYCDFREISYQVYLKPGEYVALKIKNENLFKKFLFAIRKNLVEILSKYINGKKEIGLAEAMLIGYKDDLDKNLVQAYSNTGVVHIIAISGLHLGLIYGLLAFLFRPHNKWKPVKWIRPVVIIAGLWLFSLITGGSPSVMRSAVMFTCLVLGDSLSRKVSIYNSLAASAFLLLCYNPYWLWDAGFQLSYAAVLSIALFMKPLYNCFFIQNKILDVAWKLNAVTISAQVLTVPVGIYHFHQFPNLFLITNLVAVPVSGVILFGEIILCAAFFIPPLAKLIGYLLSGIIWLLNSFVVLMDSFSFAVLDSLQVSAWQLVFIYISIACFTVWLLYKKKTGFITGLTALLIVTALRSYSFMQAAQQQKLVVYNVPQHRAIDFISGRDYFFKGDSLLLQDDFLQNFHLNPSRTLHRITAKDSIAGLLKSDRLFHFGNTSVLLVDAPLPRKKFAQKIIADIVILSKNPKIYINQLTDVVACKQVVIDGSNPAWKVNRWKQECKQLGLACYSVADEGAFVLNLH